MNEIMENKDNIEETKTIDKVENQEPKDVEQMQQIDLSETSSDSNLEFNVESNLNSNNLVVVKLSKKLVKKRIVIILLLIICIACLVTRLVFFRNDNYSIQEYELVIDGTHSNILQLQAEEAERQLIKAEEEARAKLLNRNVNDFTPEQVEKVKGIYAPTDKKIAYLTFDDGPSANVTPLILDVLKEQKIKATFFVLGSNATWNPQILKRERAEGHYIANHGYSHKYDEIYKDYDSLMYDYNLCEQAIKNSLEEPNYKTRIFRFPGGSNGGKYNKFKKDAKAQMQEQNITYLDWNALTCDAEGVPTKESLLENIKNTTQGKNSIVILMHDASTKILTYETLTEVINYLRDEGYEFGDMYDLIGE